VGDYHNLMCQPLDERRAPATLADAKFSLPFLVSVAIVRRGMSVTDFSATGLRDPEILAVGRSVSLMPDPALDWKMELPAGRVEIRTRDGRSWIREGSAVPGNPDNPMSWEDVCVKFQECAAESVTSISIDKITRAMELARALDHAADATEIMRMLS
jgi:2-methylcitrate dehydratase PrpD